MAESLKQRAVRYRRLTEAALEKVSISAEKGSVDFKRANDFISMAQNYFNDAKHFEQKGKPELALAAFSYAHAWLDAGVRAGFLDGKGDDRLFTLP
ncbi:MAG: DUF357 domain-containing protein [archaeon]